MPGEYRDAAQHRFEDVERHSGPDLFGSSVLSSSVAIAFKWRGLAPRRRGPLRIVVRVAWP